MNINKHYRQTDPDCDSLSSCRSQKCLFCSSSHEKVRISPPALSTPSGWHKIKCTTFFSQTQIPTFFWDLGCQGSLAWLRDFSQVIRVQAERAYDENDCNLKQKFTMPIVIPDTRQTWGEPRDGLESSSYQEWQWGCQEERWSTTRTYLRVFGETHSIG